MERDLYPRRWGLGPVALEKKKMKSDGKLDVRMHLVFTRIEGGVLIYHRNTEDPMKQRQPNGTRNTRISLHL